MKVKIILGVLLSLGIISVSSLSMRQVIATKAEGLEVADQIFSEFVLSDTGYNGEIEYTYKPLYNEELEINGRQYNFTIGAVDGYALLTEIQGINKIYYEIEELFYNRQSPFEECEGLPIYITHRVYLEYKDDAFYNVFDGSIVSDEIVDECAYRGFGYYGSSGFVEQVQTVNYANKSTENYAIPYDLPNYFGRVDEVTGCANNAGACVIGYYDRFYENLIPNYKSYVKIGNVLRYRTGTPEVFELVEELYKLMGTDVNHLGTTFSEFQDGMSRYVTNKGYTYSTTNVFTNGSFNIEKYKSSVKNGRPVALFMTGFALLNGIAESANMDTISSGYSKDSHVLVGCGYKIDKYYDSNGFMQDVRTYLKVASGSNIYGIGYLNINSLGQMDRAVSITIS